MMVLAEFLTASEWEQANSIQPSGRDLWAVQITLEPTLGMSLAEWLPTLGEEALALQVLVAFLQVRG